MWGRTIFRCTLNSIFWARIVNKTNCLEFSLLYFLNFIIMAKDHGPQIKDDEVYEALRDKGYSQEKAARIANSDRQETSAKGGHASKYEERSKKELYQQAKELGIEKRSSMSKKQLINALRNH